MNSEDRFSPVPREIAALTGEPDRWRSLEISFLDLLSECSMIVERGREEFDARRSLSYRAAEAVIIHFDDLLGRLPEDRVSRLPAGLSLAAVRRTRNILSHDYRKARKDIVWDVVESRIPAIIIAIVK